MRKIDYQKAIVKKYESPIESMRERVYQYLCGSIVNGIIKSGDFLDQDLVCSTLNISKAPLRDALIHLESERFITIIARKGIY